ncbi:hypothetical protein DLAC_09940 [Tieghemostelium lacteum]|uniref:B box-type domain-containing protein n=1 Tax=Tieghemostelium lacteum TaxID=361077 RepID=A0A151Z5P8_TIELA|nr:hypothetical protein DLAC_09940 [Tieghemostelium lacteum]|eukprot:KYQ89280.1 hypothetical protein DLAC_09940 [Tieghemostelium lacteum]
MAEGCKKNQHLRAAEMYCKDCFQLLCLKCLKQHSTHFIVDVHEDEEVKSCLEDTHLLEEQLKKLITSSQDQRESNIQSFNDITLEPFQKETDKISVFFRNLHDSLHVKEVELKRELKSYFDDNQENLILCNSKLDDNLVKSQNLIQALTTAKQDTTSTLNESLIKLSMETKKFLAATSSNGEELNKNINYFHGASSLNAFDELIGSFTIKKRRAYTPGPHKHTRARYIYCYGSEFERYDLLEDYKLEKIPVLGDKLSNRMYLNVRQSMMVSTSDNLFIFCHANYWKYTPETKTWFMGTFDNGYEGGTCQSAIWDGGNYIYLFGGSVRSVNHSHINRFNIIESTFEYQYHNLRFPCRNLTPLLVPGEDQIYLISGYSQTSNLVDYIDLYDLKTNSIMQITNHTTHPQHPQMIISAVYVHFQKCIYLLTYTHQFFKFDLATSIFTSITSPLNESDLDSRLLYFDNTIYLIPKGIRAVHEFSIIDNKWSKIDGISIVNTDFGLCLGSI